MLQGPIVIGGIGGSGTRAVAAILRNFEIYIGDDLNSSLDNISYTFLFKRPKWFYKNRSNKRIINTGLHIFEKSLKSNKHYSPGELTFLINATISMARYGHNAQKHGSGLWAFRRLFHILYKRQNNILSYNGYGWKEPNSHLIIENMNEHFTQLKYIHVVRNGLDMAYSTNQQQLYNWGPMFGVPLPETKEEIPLASFRYWVEINRNVLELSNKLGPDKILFVNFDNLCVNPEIEIKKLINFLGIRINKNQLKKAVAIPVVPHSKDRFLAHDISDFRRDDLEFLHSLGFKSS